ncbi:MULTISPECIES: hypothetical protein [unclassified Croceitalea]
MVEVFRKDGTSEKAEELGEVIFDDGKYFRLHSSDRVFSKSEYKYTTKL